MASLMAIGAEPAAIRSSVADVASIRAQLGQRAVSKGEPTSRQRSRIWEFHPSLHCSIIGTCLTTAELKQVLRRYNVEGAETADEHGVHQLGVMLAGKPWAGAKHVQKALDRRHRLAINKCAKAKDADALLALWDEAVKRGDIPGAYWAVLTHPASTEAVVKRVFGDVHMLSHLVGAANRADIQRLRLLEDENVALAATIERQHRQLHDGFTARDATIRRLTDALARKAGEEVAAAGMAEDMRALMEALASRDKRLAEETLRRERLDQRLGKLAAESSETERARRLAEAEREALRRELASVESQIAMRLPGEAGCEAGGFDFGGRCVLYVGGRAHQTPQLRALVERINGRFLHHDGGLEHNAALLPGLVSRADVAVFPVDCVSHEAVAALKRACRLSGKRYLALRTSSLACLLAALTAHEPGAEATQAVPA